MKLPFISVTAKGARGSGYTSAVTRYLLWPGFFGLLELTEPTSCRLRVAQRINRAQDDRDLYRWPASWDTQEN